MLKKIAIATSSFGQFDVQPLKILEKNGFSFVLNKEGRTLKREELLTLAQGCLGVIAGTEPYNQETLEYLPDLRIISRCGSGTDNLDLQAVMGTHKLNARSTPFAKGSKSPSFGPSGIGGKIICPQSGHQAWTCSE